MIPARGEVWIMDMRQKVIVVAVVAVAVLAAALFGMTVDNEERSASLNSDLTVEQNGELVYMDRFGIPDTFRIAFDPGAERTEWVEDALVIALDPEDGHVKVGYKASFAWSETSRHLVEVCSDQETGWDVVVKDGSADVTDEVYGNWIRTGISDGRASYSVEITVDSSDVGLSVYSMLVPSFGDLTGQEFGYRIVGQNSEGLLSGEMTFSYEETPDGTGYLVEMDYSIDTATGMQLSGMDYIVTSKNAPWTDGAYAPKFYLDTYWGPTFVDDVRIEGEDSVLERYVADGIIYESVYTMDDVLVIAMLESSGLLGERTTFPTEYTCTYEVSGTAIEVNGRGWEESNPREITGAASVERLDSTGTYCLMRSMQLIIVGDEVWMDEEALTWTSVYDESEPVGDMVSQTISTVWGEVEVESWADVDPDGRGMVIYYTYGGVIPLKETVWERIDDNFYMITYDAVGYTFEGEVCDSLDELLPHFLEW